MSKVNIKKVKVVVAMSGGVDSSVALALLKKQGYDVTGVFMHFWSETPESHVAHSYEFINRCCSLEAERIARGVCDKMGVSFYALNVAAEFKKSVVDYFLSEFDRGVTPNPCVVCNKEIKFKLLFEMARGFGAEFVATGHYARVKREIRNPKSEIRNKSKTQFFKLLKAKDKNKDQSYFLYNLNQDTLARSMFPIGDYLKSEVRKIAKKLKLSVWDRPESQEICFILDNDIRRFLKKNLDLTPGKIVDISGKVLGTHSGLPLFTIGQRHGLGIGGGRPYYVIKMDYKDHSLVVTDDPDDKALFQKELAAHDVNWIGGEVPEDLSAIALATEGIKCKATIRYRHKPENAVVKLIAKDNYKVEFDVPQRAVTPGQSVVFYKGDEVLGGGIID